MSQTEIAGCRVTLAGEIPAKGHRFPDLELTSASGRRFRLSDYRGRSNLVLVFADDRSATANLLADLAASYNDLKSQQEAEVIAVAQSPSEECVRIKEELRLPFAILPDADGRIHREAGASDPQGNAAAAVYVTDRYGEVFAAYQTAAGGSVPQAAEILGWLEFINIQCPECEPPEWPA